MNKISNNELIRSFLTFSITLSVIIISFLVPHFPIYLEVLKQLSIPLVMVLSGWFSVHIIKNYKKQISKEQ